MNQYHMRRQDFLVTDKAEINQILKRGKYINIALSKNNEPYIVCLSYGYDENNNSLYMHCASEGQKLDFIKANPKACGNIIIDRGYIEGKCAHAYTSVVLRGEFSEITDTEEKRQAFNIMAKHLEQKPQTMVKEIASLGDVLNRVKVLKLSIHDLTAKKNNH